MKLVTPSQMREIEQFSNSNRYTYKQLMENAGLGLTNQIQYIHSRRNIRGKQIIFLCGKGNNAGDCFTAGRHLSKFGFDVFYGMLCGEPSTDICREEFQLVNSEKVIYDLDNIKQIITESDMIIDGVFGTGFKGELPYSIKEIFAIKTSGVKVAVDVPSGGNSASGGVSDGTFMADYTVCFGYRKFGMEQYPLKDYCGKVIDVKIGLGEDCFAVVDYPIELLSAKDIIDILPERPNDTHKGNFGRLLCITGSETMIGACMLSTAAALRCGAGLVETATPKETVKCICSALPETIWLPLKADSDGYIDFSNNEKIMKSLKKATAVLIGCGMGVTQDTKKLICSIIENAECPIIIDADGINCLADCIDIIRKAKQSIVLTPHPAEFSRITGKSVKEIQSDRLGSAREFAAEYGVTVVLKGAGTVIADKNGAFVNTTGNAGMSRGGSGDVLAGMTASFIAQGISVRDSVRLSVYLHGRAGDVCAEKYSQQSMLPTDMLEEIRNWKGLFE